MLTAVQLAQAGQAQFNPMTLLLPILVLVFFWLVLIRPQRKRQREAAQMQAELQPGQEVMTGAGLFGTVVRLEDDVVILETAPGVEQRFVRQAIVRVIQPTAPDDASSLTESTDTSSAGSSEGTDSASGESGTKRPSPQRRPRSGDSSDSTETDKTD
jgi:preprotein translocase subunit YajC